MMDTPDDAHKDGDNEPKNRYIDGRGRFLQMLQRGPEEHPFQDEAHMSAPIMGSIDQPGRSE